MRKRTIKYLCDSVMWYIIYLLPIFAYLLICFNDHDASLSGVMTSLGVDIFSDNVIYTSLSSLFGASGVLPLFDSPDLLAYMSYFVSVWLVHVAVDVLLFIVRWFHELMDNFGGHKD